MATTLTSRERVLRTFHHANPDRVPINYMSNPGIHKRLMAHYGLAENDWDGLANRLGVDFRGIWLPYTGPRLHAEVPDRRVEAQWGMHTKWIEHGSGGYWDFCDYPLKDAPPEVFDNWPMPNPDHYDYAMVAETCRKHADKAIHIGSPGVGDIMNSSGMLMGVEQAMMDIVDPDSPLQRFTERRMAAQIGQVERVLELAKGRVDFMWLGEDLGTQRGPIISMDTYRRFLKPRHQRFVDLAKSYNIPVMIHCCGSSSWVFDEFLSMGITIVDTLQPEATNMSPAYLKKRWGDKLSFHGCMSTAGPVATGTVADVVKNVKETLEVMMPGSGYCMSPTHSLQDNSPTENVVAMYDAAKEFGVYR